MVRVGTVLVNSRDFAISDVLDASSLGLAKCRTPTPFGSLTCVSSEWMVQIALRIFETSDVLTFTTSGTPISRMSISRCLVTGSPEWTIA
jgi:hypothetical protein